MRILAAVLFLAWSSVAIAQAHSAQECLEGGDFIRNAARSRDTGTSREFFIGRLEEDFLLIRAFPPALRWFVRNSGDEAFLRAAVEEVFDAPEDAERHRAGFLARCAQRAAGLSRPDA